MSLTISSELLCMAELSLRAIKYITVLQRQAVISLALASGNIKAKDWESGTEYGDDVVDAHMVALVPSRSRDLHGVGINQLINQH
jgi:hypothetical protein